MPESDLSLLIAAARAAGDIAKGYWRNDPEVWDKGIDDPVSAADLAVDTHLRETLRHARPDYGWLSEETEDDMRRLAARRVFIVDPIDGTRAFVAGNRTWAHSLAVAENRLVTSAVVYLPLRDKLYAAQLGGGATLNDAPIGTSTRARLTGAAILAARPTFEPAHWPGGVPDITRHFRPSLAYRLSLVAEGRFDGMLTLRDSWEWDIAAGSLIATEAGAMVTDRSGAQLSFNSRAAKTAGVIACARTIYPSIFKRLC